MLQTIKNGNARALGIHVFDMFLTGNMQADSAERHQSRFSTKVIWTDGRKVHNMSLWPNPSSAG